MLLLACPLVGHSLLQAVFLYSEASAAGLQSPVLASSLSPLDGILVPTFGASYVAVTLLFPFVAIRVLGSEKESGALRLSVQLPYRPATLIAVKLAAILGAWLLVTAPALSALLMWLGLGGHVYGPETFNLILGHLLYGILVGSIALFAASVAESAATAAIIALSFTIGSWVLDFTLAGQPGPVGWIGRISLTQVLRPFEQGLLSVSFVVGAVGAICGFAALATVWLPPGAETRTKLLQSAVVILVTAGVVAIASQSNRSIDLTEDQRNSFGEADRHALSTLSGPLRIRVHMAPEDPRYVDLNRSVLSKLERAMPNVIVRLAGGRQSAAGSGDDRYGEVEYVYGARSDVSRSTSPREILPLIYGLAGVQPPSPNPSTNYPGYPLMAHPQPAAIWFFGGLPLLVVFAWWLSRRPPRIRPEYTRKGGQP
jgi:hypothetical protein